MLKVEVGIMFSRTINFRLLMRILLFCTITLILLLAAYQTVPFTWTGSLMSMTALQGGRCERIAKNVLEMRYQAKNRAEAVSELENMLPQWEHTQALLERSLPPEAKPLFNFTQVDFIDIDTAVHKILINPNLPTDPLQTQIVLDHEWQYYTSTIQIMGVLAPRSFANKVQLIVVEWIIDLLILGASIWRQLMIEKALHRLIAYEKVKEEKGQPK